MGITSTGMSGNASITQVGPMSYRVLSGATLITTDKNYATTNVYVEGLGAGGTDNPAMLIASAASVAYGATAVSGGVVLAGGNGQALGGTAYESGGFAAINDGVVSGVTVGNLGGVLASKIGKYSGEPGLVLNAHVQAGGVGLAGGGFTLKGQAFAGPGVISGSKFDIGSTEALASGGTDIGSIVGGTQLVSAGGSSVSTIFSAGTQLLGDGAFATDCVASAGGLIHVGGGALSLDMTLGSGGSLLAEAGANLNTLAIQQAAAATLLNDAYLINATINAGGTMTVNSGATLINAVISGICEDDNLPGGLLIVQSGAVLQNITVGWKGRIDIDTLSWNEGQRIVYSHNTISIVDVNGNVLWQGDVHGTKGNASSDYHLERDPADGSAIIVYDKCYLTGTLIRTERGEIAVEDLVVGDRVAALVDGDVVMREIVWLGHRSSIVRTWLEDDEAGYPVRILRNALGENVPSKDLLVTPEHAMYLNGAFVPARMLVNGRSIAYDRSITHFDYYHIETDKHSIIWADGALSESYLDTGDRRRFAQPGAVVHLINAPEATWEGDGAAPLRVDRGFVEPLHASLSHRAASLNLGSQIAAPEITEDPDLHLVDDRGRIMRRMRMVNRSSVFMVPPDARRVRIVSRVSRPMDVIGPFHDDRRHLGVLVGDIQIWEADQTRHLASHLRDETLEGWSNIEDGRQRWTTGSALLDLSDRKSDAVCIVAIEVLAGGPYLAQSPVPLRGAQVG
ncbi:Hint domain-containing protein [Asaia krungthepensis]|uniref:Outer membrane protein n=1 Tax=Asaia krungthepensis NRIC 0535 TaxID=1307925 RepID=A0ABQ0Q6R8_9PROT|nr:Hint domain-containing protein [Asaia krungthepensis]GBQ93816.1 outer membrane protein [Asaia krungthepensis NRIC 0535]